MTKLIKKVAQRWLRMASPKCTTLQAGDRYQHLDQLWEAYKITYTAIGLHLSNPRDLLDYDIWKFCLDSDNNLRQFTLFKKTRYGLKMGLAGHDGTSEGKRWAVLKLKEAFKTPGVYGEISHKIKAILLAERVPVICSNLVPKVLGVKVQPVGLIEYVRSIGNLSNITKTLAGRPNGIETTSSESPSCPMTREMTSFTQEPWDRIDLDSHMSCLRSCL